MYILEGYPEFEQDIKEIWNDFISENNFEIVKTDDESIELRNKNCILQLDLNVGQRIYYCFQNPRTLKVTDYITLEIYFGINSFSNLVGGGEYPLSMNEWIKLYAKDDYRSICRIDLPIILKEIKENFEFIIKGDFSWEENIDDWEKWYDVNRKPGVPGQHRELSYKHFLKATENKS